MSRIAEIKKFGQKIWLDNISREFLASGNLQKMVAEDGIAGVTSNPAIFFKAISTDSRYQTQLTELKKQDLTPLQRYEKLAVDDIKQACQIMSSLYKSSNKEDGYVSLEVSPDLCHDASDTVNSALELWAAVNEPNLMIKVPATKAGVVAFEELVKQGLNVNITLLFNLEQVNAIWDAYLRGLDYRLNKSLPIDSIKTVASFFLSRIDSAVDDKLPEELKGTAAITLAKAAYNDYLKIFHGERFAKFKQAGAKPQYLLWASTGTKNKNYSDVLYIEELIGAETINTVPDATLDNFRDHGIAENRLNKDLNLIDNKLAQIANAGINLHNIGEELQKDGLQQFSDAFDKLLLLTK
ncbi:MAG: transaldolase [Neisseriaceae bacterium]|nr:MAG: transaldolase [Neisseriaceae bacterium]